MRRAFNPLKELSIKFLGDNKFLFRFEHQADYSRVELGIPWHFENHLLVLGGVPPGGHAGSVSLNTCPFTVQIHNLPFLSFPRGVATTLGNRIGEFISAELDTNGKSKVAALRLRVAVDIRKPLIRALKVPDQDGSLVTAAITYEKLPILCSACGKLDHQSRYCVIARESGAKPPTDQQYGIWLRATPPRILEPMANRKERSDSTSGTSSSEPSSTNPIPPSPSSAMAMPGVQDHPPPSHILPDTPSSPDPGMMMLDSPTPPSSLVRPSVLVQGDAMEGIVQTRKRALFKEASDSEEEERVKGPKLRRSSEGCSTNPAEAAVQPRHSQ
ncbi:hypothetical protein M569_13126 [Genlisea aurea]|uniref:Zinc knuckle CX2CX4HX4C domain-containing protein n=1 Tax=Genlisea aurea TaxID=192259 RepID=S8C4P8_9LAMI|nr:hypothetical protein M569_13126 [Genlisea aurea]